MSRPFRRGLSLALLLLAAGALPAAAESRYFDDSPTDRILVGNGTHFEVAVSKINGAFISVLDKTTGQFVSVGAANECQFSVGYAGGNPSRVDGCTYASFGPARFTYSWSPESYTLTLTYTNAGSLVPLDARVDLSLSDEAWFDLRLTLLNRQSGTMRWIRFPYGFVFSEADIDGALLPILPGVVFEPAFFDRNQGYVAGYPGYPGMFADYFAVWSAKGRMAVEVVAPPAELHPSRFGFVHDDLIVLDSAHYFHEFGAWAGGGQAWTSPVVRVRVAQDLRDSILATRADNGLDSYSGLVEKAGPLFDRLAQAPLYKADADQIGLPFAEYGPLLDRVPAPGILHPVAYQPGGHDSNDPDFLPPNPAWGTTAAFAGMFRAAQSRGLFVMPYTNPTWWNELSPTLQNLPPPLTIDDVASLDDRGNPRLEEYGPQRGYMMSPWPTFVRNRIDSLVSQMTTTLPSDFLFEDQIGARPWDFDFNPSSPSPVSYMDGWLNHVERHAGAGLMTELGFDRLGATELGFHGSVLLPERYGLTDEWWGTATWHAYPLATLLLRDKVFFYQHDLAPETMTVDLPTLRWNLAFGYQLSYDLTTGGLSNPWKTVVSAFQSRVLARYAADRLTDFTSLQPDLTRTDFETASVVANWDDGAGAAAGAHVLAPGGVMVASADGHVTAGVFTRFNNEPLDPGGAHYLIEERGDQEVVVRQVLGGATWMAIEPLPSWGGGASLVVQAMASGGRQLGRLLYTVVDGRVRFRYPSWLSGAAVEAVRVATASADLVVTQVSSPRSARPGRAILVRNIVRNRGIGKAGAFDVGLYLSTDPTIDPAGDRLLKTRRVTSLRPGGLSIALSRAVLPSDLQAGTYYLGAAADIGNAIDELDEGNNTRAANIAIQIVVPAAPVR